MKRLLLTSASLLALMAAAPRASATTFTFNGMIVDFTVPDTGTYQIIAFGAQGGDGSTSNDTGAVGGKGAKIQGDFQLASGDHLKIVVGGAGQSGSYYGGGGGGSFVFVPNGQPLVVAGGGGGAGGGAGPKGNPPTPTGALPLQSGTGGQTGKDGGDGASERFLNDGFGGSGGSGGYGGLHLFYVGGGGGGAALRAPAATEAARMGDMEARAAPPGSRGVGEITETAPADLAEAVAAAAPIG
jgi:hypothetical protein